MEDKIRVCLKGDTSILLNKSDGRRIIAGYANVAIIDQENQYIPLAVLQKGIQSLLADSSYANLMIMHKNIQIGKIVDSYGKFKTGVDNKGLFIVCEIRKDIKVADEIWGMILKKEISGFSIGCEVLLSHKVCDNKECVTVLDKINIFEVSVCTEPVNQKSGFIVISKSDFEKFHSNIDMLNVDNRNKENMAEEIENKETPCETCKDPVVELSIEDRLEALEIKMAELITKKQEEQVPVEEVKKDIPQEIKAPEEPIVPEEEEEPMEEPPEEEDMAIFMLDYIVKNPKASAQDIAKAWIKSKRKASEVSKSEEVKDNPLMESLMKNVNSINEKLSKLDYSEELKTSLKARDDAIQALEKKLELLSKAKEPEIKEVKKVEEKKSEPEMKTLQEPKEPALVLERPIKIRNGEITSSEFM